MTFARLYKPYPKKLQQGLTLIGFIIIAGFFAVIGVVVLKVVPTFVEYQAVKKTIMSIRSAGTTPQEIQSAFDRQANVSYIESIQGKDLTIVRNGTSFDISFAYTKKIPLVGPASLLLEYEGTTVAESKRTALVE